MPREISYHQYEYLGLLVESIPAEHSDPFEIVAARQQEDLEQSFNSESTTMQTQSNQSTTHTVAPGTMEAALTNAGLVNSNHNYLDLHEQLEASLPHPTLRARVFSSLAWMLDTAIISNARSIFFDLYREGMEAGTIDNFAEFTSQLSELAAGEVNAVSLGFEDAGRFTTMQRMLSMRAAWQDAAASSASAAGVNYTERSIEEVLASEKPMKVDKITLEKIGIIAQAVARGDEKRAEITKSLLVEQQRSRNEQRFDMQRETGPAIIRIVNEAVRRCDDRSDDDTSQFYLLPTELQARFIKGAVTSVDRAMSDLSTYRSISTIEFAGIVNEALQAKDELESILNSNRFKVLAQ